MAKTVKAFASHSDFTNNNRLVINTVGELSTQSLTYERDVPSYSNSNNSKLTMYIFQSMENDRDIEISVPDLELVQNVAEYVYTYSITENKEIYPDVLKRKLLDQFRGKAQRHDCGSIVTDGQYYLPQWVYFQDLSGNDFKIWFSDASFRAEYDDFEIEVIAPVDNFDVFFSNRSEVEKELDKYPIDVLTRKANAIKDNTPETVFRLDIFKWFNPVTHVPELDTNWYILIWGDAGDNIDAIKTKIQDVILANSNHTRDEWKNVFPEIFKRNEFIIVPQWDVYSNENKIKSKASLYSPLMKYSEMVTKYAKPFMTQLNEDFIRENLQSIGLYYRGVCGVVCGNDENKDDKFTLTEVFPDYIDVPSTNTDFGYQSTETQKWSLKLQEMLELAENMTETSPLPRDRITLPGGQIVPGEKIYTRLIRDDKLYIVMKYQDFHYLVAAKKNFV